MEGDMQLSLVEDVCHYTCLSVCLINLSIHPFICTFFYLINTCIFSTVCSDGDLRIYNNYTTVVDGNNVIIGIPQQCYQEAWGSVCNDGTNTPNLVELVCWYLGFTGQS